MPNGVTVKGVGPSGSQKATGVRTLRQEQEKENPIVQIINSDKTKRVLNYAGNGGATILNFFTFLNGNFHFFDSIQEKLESFTEIFTKIATGTQGLILATDTWNKRNLIPFIGYLLEIPIAIFSSGYDLWLARGFSQGLGQFLGMIDRREVVDDKGNLKLQDGRPVTLSGDFNYGAKGLQAWKEWGNSFITTVKEIPKLAREFIDKPSSRIKDTSHCLFLASAGQIIGASIAFLGLRTFGAFIRDIFGTLVDFALINDKKIVDNPDYQISNKHLDDTRTNNAAQHYHKKRGLNFKSLFVWAGLTWVLAAIVDYFKRIPFLSQSFECLTNLSLTSDRGASLLYTMENLRIKNIQNQSKTPEVKLLHAVFGVRDIEPLPI